MTYSRLKGIVSLAFCPPVVVENLTVLPLVYQFPEEVIKDGTVKANSNKCFYFDTGTLFNVDSTLRRVMNN